MKRLILILVLPLFCFGGLIDDLLHYYPFDKTYNDTTGTCDGTSINFPNLDSIGISGKCLSMPNTSYLDFGTENLDIGDSVTISLWVRRFGSSTGVWCLDGDLPLNYTGIEHFVSGTTGNNAFKYGDGDGAGSTDRKSYTTSGVAPAILDSSFHHIIIQPVDIDTVIMFIDGIKYLPAYSSGTATTVNFIDAQYQLGDVSTSYQGSIDELAIFNYRIDSATIVDSLWNDGNGWFPFTETDTFLIEWNGIDLDLIEWNGIDIDLLQSINGINLK